MSRGPPFTVVPGPLLQLLAWLQGCLDIFPLKTCLSALSENYNVLPPVCSRRIRRCSHPDKHEAELRAVVCIPCSILSTQDSALQLSSYVSAASYQTRGFTKAGERSYTSSLHARVYLLLFSRLRPVSGDAVTLQRTTPKHCATQLTRCYISNARDLPCFSCSTQIIGFVQVGGHL